MPQQRIGDEQEHIRPMVFELAHVPPDGLRPMILGCDIRPDQLQEFADFLGGFAQDGALTLHIRWVQMQHRRRRAKLCTGARGTEERVYDDRGDAIVFVDVEVVFIEPVATIVRHHLCQALRLGDERQRLLLRTHAVMTQLCLCLVGVKRPGLQNSDGFFNSTRSVADTFAALDKSHLERLAIDRMQCVHS